jgi:hypothetical protein
MGYKIRMSTVVLGFLCATAFGGCEEEDDTHSLGEYCIDEYSDCLKDCRGPECIGCESEYNNCVQLSEIYR